MISVGEIMTNDVITLEKSDPISKAVSTMTENNIRHIPIVDTEKQLLGIISQRDVLKAGADNSDKNTVGAITVSEIMTEKTLTTHPKESLRAAGLTLQKHKYGCLPVIDGNKLVGIITDTDFVSIAINLIEQQDDMEDNF